MDNLPVEVIGNILSRLEAARDIVVASATCRKWRDAWRNHLDALSFNSNDWHVYHDIPTCRLERIITQTIFQTTGLHSLSILMDEVGYLTPAAVIAWLMYTRDTLRHLSINVTTFPPINILDKCGRQKLEVLTLAYNSITRIEPRYQRFPCLRCLSLCYLDVSALDLSILLTVCPRLEALTLVGLKIVVSDPLSTLELSSTSLKEACVEVMSLDKFILEADKLEKLQLKDCTFEVFELVGKGTLKLLEIDDVSVIHLDIGENTENLEVVDVSNFRILWSKFHHMIAKSRKLRKLGLWAVVFDNEDEVVDIESVSVCFPLLSHLSLNYDLRDGPIQYGLQGSFQLENVVVLELGWTVINDAFSQWVAWLLEKCPNLVKLVVHGLVSEIINHEECNILANFTSTMVRLMRKYMHVVVQFEYE